LRGETLVKPDLSQRGKGGGQHRLLEDPWDETRKKRGVRNWRIKVCGLAIHEVRFTSMVTTKKTSKQGDRHMFWEDLLGHRE